MRWPAVLLAVCGACATPLADAAGGTDARVLGTFTMQARVTVAVNVRGERQGELLTRRWQIVARGCQRDQCASLVLERQRAGGLTSRIVLQRVGFGRYAGRGAFFAPLRCRRRVYPRGSRAPYEITLTVSQASLIGGIRFARRITATYVNLSRSDTTPCPLRPSHDSATYAGAVTRGLPSAPRASFTATVDPSAGTVRFHDTSSAGDGNGRIAGWTWYFGDPRSPYGNSSTRRDPRHVFTAPRRYRVKLRVVAADGLSDTTTRTVRVPPPPNLTPTTTTVPIPPPPNLSPTTTTVPGAPLH